MIFLKSSAEIDALDAANALNWKALRAVEEMAVAGVSTLELDRRAEEVIRSGGGIPAFKGYRGFPGTLCVSVNDVIVHGIPNRRERLREGDLVSVDCGVVLDGFFGDAALSFGVGQLSEEADRLIRVTKRCLEDAVECVRPGARLGDIGAAVQSCAEGAGFGVVRDFVGHGIGRSLHEDPQVPNYGIAGKGLLLKPGLVIAIEPMVTAGSWRVKVDEDGWTARTEDGRIAAHFEFSLAVTTTSHRVLGTKES